MINKLPTRPENSSKNTNKANTSNKFQTLYNKHLFKSTNLRDLDSMYKNKKELPVAEKKESVYEFMTRYEKRFFCHMSASEIEEIMNKNRRKIEELYQ